MLRARMSYLSPPIQAIIELFQGPLAEVRFADVDASTLTNLARAVEAAAADLAAHEAQVSELRQILADRQDALLALAQRGLAYARVYAEPDEALSEQLSAINLARASKPRKASSKVVSSESVHTESTVGESPSAESIDAPAAADGEALTEASASTADPVQSAATTLDGSAPEQPARRSKAQSRQRHSEAS